MDRSKLREYLETMQQKLRHFKIGTKELFLEKVRDGKRDFYHLRRVPGITSKQLNAFSNLLKRQRTHFIDLVKL